VRYRKNVQDAFLDTRMSYFPNYLYMYVDMHESNEHSFPQVTRGKSDFR